MDQLYDTDILAWSAAQATLLRARRLSELDLDNIAEEIEDVGMSVKRELRSRLAVLIAHLLKWRYQPQRRSKSWLRSINAQRQEIADELEETPSLSRLLDDPDWMRKTWHSALVHAYKETGLTELPAHPVWPVEHLIDPEFFPTEG